MSTQSHQIVICRRWLFYVFFTQLVIIQTGLPGPRVVYRVEMDTKRVIVRALWDHSVLAMKKTNDIAHPEFVQPKVNLSQLLRVKKY